MSFNKKPLVTATILLLVSTSQAQTNTDFQAVTVYGSRFKETIENALPQTTIITSSEIEKSGLSNVSEVLQKIGGLNVKQNLDGSTNSTVDIRGFGDTADNNTLILLDGVRLSENEQASARTSLIPLEAIDHIEITRGGNSVLYGDGATAGTINIVTKRDQDDLTVISAGLGSYSSYQSNVFQSKKIANTNFTIYGRQFKNGGYRDNSETAEQSLGFSAVTKLSPNEEIGVRVLGSQERNKLPGALPISQINTNPTNSQVPGYSSDMNIKTSNITLFGTKKIEDVELKIDINQYTKTNFWGYNYDASSVYRGYSTYYNSNQSPYSWGTTNSLAHTYTANPRVKLNNFIGAGSDLIIGYDWLSFNKKEDAYKTNSDSSFYSSDSSSYNINDGSYGKKSFKSEALYTKANLKIENDLKLSAGARRQFYKQSSDKNYYSGGNTHLCGTGWYACDPSSASFNSSGKADAFDTQITKTINASLKNYFKISQNFRFANLDDNAQAPYSQNNNLTPQTSHDYEIGTRYQTNSLRADFRIYISHLKNEIGFDGSNNVNYSPTVHKGIESINRIKLDSKWGLMGSVNLVEAKFKSGTYEGKTIPNVSSINGSIGGEYFINSKEKVAFLTRFSSDAYASNDMNNNQGTRPGYAISDITHIYSEKSWQIISSINNIFDKQYTDAAIYKSSYEPLYRLTVYPNPGRNFSLTARYVF
jgi:iron complex outermembrane receptor protein